jgi:glycogen operon protein
VNERDEPVRDDSLLLLFNADHQAVEFVLPPRRFGLRWKLEISTAEPDAPNRELATRDAIPVEALSMVVLSRSR